MKFIIAFLILMIVNGLNDFWLIFKQTGEWSYYVVVYGAIHFIVFAGVYYLVFKKLITEERKLK